MAVPAQRGAARSLLVLTELGFIEGIFLTRLENQISPGERHAQQRIPLLLQFRLHPHRIRLLDAALADHCRAGGADPGTTGARQGDPSRFSGVKHGLIRPAGEAVGDALKLGAYAVRRQNVDGR